MAELAATPQFTDWVIERADRIKLISNDSSDESIGSKSSSIDEEAEESSSQFRFFSWNHEVEDSINPGITQEHVDLASNLGNLAAICQVQSL
ncbi:hypothetical protein SLEP1_g39293 [Rubroshorea leprosula]|uniref:Uncharacterized protein n=1 Tax=Rubroshorea leprosula TaxID=152421 RepID=A0AAV5L0G9_9ROSI|nr:hypothetical protein SLEP1_g39293 [Rubroshorea leprosula]